MIELKPGKIIETDCGAWLFLKAIEWLFIKGPILAFAILLIYVWVSK